MDPATAVVIAACIAAIASIVNTLIGLYDRRKVKETHVAVTQNGGKNSPPTVLDKLSDIKSEVRSVKESQIEQGAKLDAHILWHLSNKETTP
jgi:hypothetical protein